MRRITTASALFALALLAATAGGQPPEPKKADPKPPDPTDAAIAAALANDPDVKVAQAKIQLAQAELAKARQAVAIKVAILRAEIDAHAALVDSAQKKYNQTLRISGEGTRDALDDRMTLAMARAKLAKAEAELKLLIGTPDGGAGAADHEQAVERGLKWLAQRAGDPNATVADRHSAVEALLLALGRGNQSALKGPIPDRLRAALDKPVKLPKGQVSFRKALEIINKEVGFDVPVRGARPAVPDITSEGEELPLGAWFQLFEDGAFAAEANKTPIKLQFYVRDYGLLVTRRDAAPPDAPTLTEFWKQKPTVPEPKKQ